MTPTSEFRTQRLCIRLVRTIPPEALCRYLVENRDAHGPWEPTRNEDYFSLESVKARLFVEDVEKPDERRFALLFRDEQEVVGLVNFTNIVGYPFHACHLGFSIAARHEGKGLMREGLLCTITEVFDTTALNRVMANFLPRNFRSAQLLSGLGFQIEGFAKDYLCIAGRWEDHLLSSILSKDWFSEVASSGERAAL